jgi:hypothetical protein
MMNAHPHTEKEREREREREICVRAVDLLGL